MTPAQELTRSIIHADTPEEAGGTVALNGLPLPTTGFFVGGATESLIFERLADVDPGAIERYVTYAPSAYVGWWVDDETGKVYVDAVDWYANEFTASAIARTRKEIAVWDIARVREVRLTYVEGE